MTATLTGKWAILPEDHPTILRRLATEINSRAYHGIYATFADGERCRVVAAKYTKGGLVIRTMESDQWKPYRDVTRLVNDMGDTVCASRTVCGQ